MSPDQRAGRDRPPPTTCANCDGDLGGNLLRCSRCVAAAHEAIRTRLPGQPIYPADIAAIREREG